MLMRKASAQTTPQTSHCVIWQGRGGERNGMTSVLVFCPSPYESGTLIRLAYNSHVSSECTNNYKMTYSSQTAKNSYLSNVYLCIREIFLL